MGYFENFKTLEEIIVATAAMVKPPERLTVSEVAAKYRKLNNPGSYVGPWKNSTTPYLVEPMDILTSEEFAGMIFVGPAQTGKTDMWLNWLLYSILCDPADMSLIQTAQGTARDFSIRRIDRFHRDTSSAGEKLIQKRNADNTFDKRYTNGMLLNLSWPTSNELAGRPIPRLWCTDLDRVALDIDGEGPLFDLALKRSTSFKSFGMCVAESSPSHPVVNPKWKPKTKHEAPPTTGILSLYNRGDRRKYYWKCVSCRSAFIPDFSLLEYPDSVDIMESAEQAILKCPTCDHTYHHDEGISGPGKYEMNIGGKWVKEGMVWTKDNGIKGTPRRSDLASFWMNGTCATFTNWKTIVLRYLAAEKVYEETGSEESLKTTVNTDQGNAYIPKAEADLRAPEDIKAQARDYGIRVVPEGVRFLEATIDVQKNRFVVQVHGIGVGGDVWVVDRYDIKKSERFDDDGEHLWVNPGTYPEDWKMLVKEVLLKTYPLADGSGREMSIKLVCCDSGGKSGTTANAYKFFRWLKKGPTDAEAEEDSPYEWVPSLAARFLLLKGASSKDAPRVVLKHPDSQRKDRKAGARGEIPVLFMNTHMLKDTLNSMLDRTDDNGGRIHFPNWLNDNFYIELTVEVKDPVKGWHNPRRYRNESWDLLAYMIAGTLTKHIALEHIDWREPPGWAEEWDSNDLVSSGPGADKPFDAKPKQKYDLEKLAEELA